MNGTDGSHELSPNELSSPSTHGIPHPQTSISFDEQELAQLLAEEMSNEDPTDTEELPLEEDRNHENGFHLSPTEEALDLEEELVAALATDEGSELCPVTPEDMTELSTVLKTDPTSSESLPMMETTSIDEKQNHQAREKRRVGQSSKNEVKRKKYCETDSRVREPGWAEKVLKNRRPVWIPQITVNSKQLQDQPAISTQRKIDPKPPQEEIARVFNGGYDQRNNHRRVRPITANSIPPGWLDCPGLEGKWGFFLFSKTPLGERWNQVIPMNKRLTPKIIVETASRRNQPIGLVIDLTNSTLYYDPHEFERLGVHYLKIRCCGRGQTPSFQAVNEFWWKVIDFERRKMDKLILVHCTHGFNRTGFMVAHFIMRWAERDTINGVIRSFASRRPPGIYKDDYIEELLDYYHEPRLPKLLTPDIPSWKGVAQEEDEDLEISENQKMKFRMISKEVITADDPVGESIHPEEQHFLQNEILNLMIGPRRNFHRFPGSQPVSMDRSNLDLISKRRYWVSYKADGTRYMLLLTKHGVYVINREFEFQRVEMRFPFAFKQDSVTLNPAIPHHMTLLDGEMVIDHNQEQGTYHRKYLVYDLVFLQGFSWTQFPWKTRFAKLEEIMKTRNSEIEKISINQWPFNYQYQEEPFSVEVKLFRFLGQIDGIIKMIPHLRHECDGLIFQGYDDKYLIGTHDELLKWKYAHMNSVDFRFRLNEASESGGDAYALNKVEVVCKGVKIVFDKKEDKFRYNGKIVECFYAKEEQSWKFLRERVDKKTPNAFAVYEKVMKSIRDNITQEELTTQLLKVFKESDLYQRDREKLASLYTS